MNIRNNVTEIKLDNTSYKMKFDFETIARIQAELKKNGIPYKFFEIFEGLENQDFSIIVPLFVHCIQRMHPQIKAEAIKAHADREVVVKIAEAERQARSLRGEGDAEATKIYADAYKQNPKLFEFLRSMDAYKNSMTSGRDTLVLEPNSEFFKFFGDSNGAKLP